MIQLPIMTRLFESADSFIARKNCSKTKDTYRYALTLFGQMKFGDLPREELFQKLNGYIKKANRQVVIDDIYLFKDYLNKKRLAINSIRTSQAAVQSWFTNNDLQIPKNKSREIRGRIKPILDDKAFTLDTAQKVLEQMKSPQARCLFMFLLSTGCRVSEALQVKLSDVDWDSYPVTVTLDEQTTKTGESRKVFLTREAADFIKRVWLTPSNEGGKIQTNRERYLESAQNKASGLISQGKAQERPPIETDSRLWPFKENVVNHFISQAVKRAGFTEKTKTGILKLHTHSTRKFFRTVFGMAAGPDAAETLMGHSPGLTSSYRKLEHSELVKKWAEHESALHIYLTKEARLALQTKDFNATAIVELQGENKKLKDELGEIKHLLESVAKGQFSIMAGEIVKRDETGLYLIGKPENIN